MNWTELHGINDRITRHKAMKIHLTSKETKSQYHQTLPILLQLGLIFRQKALLLIIWVQNYLILFRIASHSNRTNRSDGTKNGERQKRFIPFTLTLLLDNSYIQINLLFVDRKPQDVQWIYEFYASLLRISISSNEMMSEKEFFLAILVMST